MRITATIVTLLIALGSASWAYANSVTYRISVTIPEIIGVNVPDPNAPSGIDMLSTNNEGLDKQTQQLVRDDQSFILETIVAK